VLGIAIGLYFFTKLDSRVLAHGLGVMVMAYAAISLWNALRPPARNIRLPRAIGPLAGTVAGMVGAVFGTMASFFFVIYLDARELAKKQFLATTSAMLLLLSTGRGIGYYAAGEFTRDSWIMFAAAFPAMLAGIYVGDRMQLGFSETTFRRVMCATLLLCGTLLLLK
jgi:uncharacterized membrane protein YfcA